MKSKKIMNRNNCTKISLHPVLCNVLQYQKINQLQTQEKKVVTFSMQKIQLTSIEVLINQ